MKKNNNYMVALDRSVKNVKASDIMSKDVICAKKTTLLSDVAKVMINKRISGLPVVDTAGKVIGIITANDLFMVMDMISSGYLPPARKGDKKKRPTVELAMSTSVHKIKKTTSLEDIIVLMRYRNAHTLPVMKGNKMVGVIGRRDVFKNFYGIIKKMPS